MDLVLDNLQRLICHQTKLSAWLLLKVFFSLKPIWLIVIRLSFQLMSNLTAWYLYVIWRSVTLVHWRSVFNCWYLTLFLYDIQWGMWPRKIVDHIVLIMYNTYPFTLGLKNLQKIVHLMDKFLYKSTYKPIITVSKGLTQSRNSSAPSMLAVEYTDCISAEG